MKKKTIISIICTGMFMCLSSAFNVSAEEIDYFVGRGSSVYPYEIDSSFRLRLFAELINDPSTENDVYRTAYYIQTNDIDLENIEWIPIASGKTSFNGHYDGGCHMIQNLKCDTTYDYAGLFGILGNGNKKSSCEISNLSVYGSVDTKGKNAGGIAGEVHAGCKILNCSFTGNVSGTENAGGIAGTVLRNTTIQCCYQNGSVTSKQNAGGLIGHVSSKNDNQAVSAILENCYHTGGLVTADKAGGGVGIIEESNTYTTSSLTMDNCYYLDENCKYAVNNAGATGCQALSEKAMKKAYTILDAPFVADSNLLNNGFPILKWQKAHSYNGDINKDNAFGKEDIVLFQKWLWGSHDSTDQNWLAGDCNQDGQLDARDFTIMKQKYAQYSGINLKKLELNKYEVYLKLEGENNGVQLYSNAISNALTWKSSDESIVTVSEDGNVRAVSSGEAVITAETANGLNASCNVTVESAKIDITKNELSLYVTETEKLEVKTTPDKQKITWKSDNAKVATVQDGVVTALEPRTANITASFMYNVNEVVSQNCIVNVLEPSVTISKKSLSLYPAETSLLGATVKPKDAIVRWTSSNSNVVIVEDGKVTAVNAGTAKVTARINIDGEAYSDECVVTVNAPSIKLTKSSLTMLLGDSTILTATIEPSNYQGTITWTSSDPSIVSVNNGSIKGNDIGKATITATMTINGKEYRAMCTVTVEEPTIKLSSTSITLNKGGTAQLTATDKHGKELKNVKYMAFDPSIVMVSSSGLVKASTMNSGTTFIQASITVNGKTYWAKCDVTVTLWHDSYY